MLKTKEIDALKKHYQSYLGDFEVLDFNPSQGMPFKPQLILSRPNKIHNYNVVATIGLSNVKFKGTYTNFEIIMLLDSKWKFKLDNMNHSWPLELMHKISNLIYLTDSKMGYGQYFINDSNKTFSPLTDMGVALLGIPAMLDKKFFEMKSGKKTVNFFVLTTATFEELKIIKKIGGINFIQRYLLPEGESGFIIHNNKL
jgi:hypothetical protein